MRCLTTVLGLVLVASACGGEATPVTTTTTPAAFPTGVVREWLDAVAAGDLREISTAVHEDAAAVVIAAENDFTVTELAALLDGGMSEGVAASYWATFDEAFREFQGIALSSLVVGDFRSLDVETVEFAAVELSSPQGSTEVVARRDEEGPWTVDMVATFGPALVRRLRGILDAAVDDPQGAVIRAGYVAAVLPGLEAATQLHEQDTLLQSELAAMHVLVGDQ